MVVSSFRGGLVAKRGRSLRPAKRQTLITNFADLQIFRVIFEYLFQRGSKIRNK